MLTIVFDLDGTLIDTAPDLISTLNLILAQEDLPPVDFDAARRLIGGGARGMIERAVTAEGPGVPESRARPDVRRIRRTLCRAYRRPIAAVPKVEATLQHLAGEGHRLAVCTNKLEWLSIRLLDTLKLSRHFAAICGQDTFGVQKPDPRMLRLTIERAGGEAGRAIMVGDSGTDIRTSRAATVPVVAVDFGYSEVPIARLSPTGSSARSPICRRQSAISKPAS